MLGGLPKDESGNPLNAITPESIGQIREMTKPMFEHMNNQFKPIIDQCSTEIIQFEPAKYGSDNQEQLEIHIHKVLGKEDKKRKAVIFFHGGGAIMSNPQQNYFMSTSLAVYGDLTVFSCQYRLGPETKVPGGILDAYAAVNYIA